MLQFQLSKENSSFPLREWKVVPYKILKTVFHFSQRPSRSNKVCLRVLEKNEKKHGPKVCHLYLRNDAALFASFLDRVPSLFDVVLHLKPLQVDRGATVHRAREALKLLAMNVAHVLQHGLQKGKS